MKVLSYTIHFFILFYFILFYFIFIIFLMDWPSVWRCTRLHIFTFTFEYWMCKYILSYSFGAYPLAQPCALGKWTSIPGVTPSAAHFWAWVETRLFHLCQFLALFFQASPISRLISSAHLVFGLPLPRIGDPCSRSLIPFLVIFHSQMACVFEFKGSGDDLGLLGSSFRV